MANDWIYIEKEFLTGNTTTFVSTEHLTVTSIKIMDLTTTENLSSVVTAVQKSIKVSANATSWIDSGTWIIVLYSVIFLLAVIGNLLVILTLIQSRRMRTITNLFLLNLAVSDLFLGVFCMPFTLVGMLLRDFIFGEIMCKLLPYLQGACNCHLNQMLSFCVRNNRTASWLNAIKSEKEGSEKNDRG